MATTAVSWAIIGGMLLSLGCATPDGTAGPPQAICPERVTTATVIRAAHDVLADMHFSIEKLDAEQGVIRTRPLRAAQFFEFWRSDNVGAFTTAEANLQSIRRIVELRVKKETEGPDSPSQGASGPHIECNVQVQRLALPANEIAGVSQAYRIHTRSDRTIQALDVTPTQRAQMAWIDLGDDTDLAAEILRRIERRLRN